jgi:hypothetical protein
MMKGLLELDFCKLPLLIKLKGEHGNYVLFTLKAAGKKLGAQLIKPDRTMLQLLEQN